MIVFRFSHTFLGENTSIPDSEGLVKDIIGYEKEGLRASPFDRAQGFALRQGSGLRIRRSCSLPFDCAQGWIRTTCSLPDEVDTFVYCLLPERHCGIVLALPDELNDI